MDMEYNNTIMVKLKAVISKMMYSLDPNRLKIINLLHVTWRTTGKSRTY